jgi:hypothetical protein
MSQKATSAYLADGKIQFLNAQGTKGKIKTPMSGGKAVLVEKTGDEEWMVVTESGVRHWYNANGDVKRTRNS